MPLRHPAETTVREGLSGWGSMAFRAFWLSAAGHAPGIGVAGGPDLPPGSDESCPDPGPETDTGATAAVPGATAGATAGLPGTGVRNTSNYSDSFSSCNQE